MKPFKEITSRLSELSRSELIELREIITALLEVHIQEQDNVVSFKFNGTKPGAAGHIEAKRIRGYGPYLYLRYWSGKKLKSAYIGKALRS